MAIDVYFSDNIEGTSMVSSVLLLVFYNRLNNQNSDEYGNFGKYSDQRKAEAGIN